MTENEKRLALYDFLACFFWVLLDGLWTIEFGKLALCFAPFALYYILRTFRYIEHSFVDVALSGAATAWICMNISALGSEYVPALHPLKYFFFALILFLLIISRIKSRNSQEVFLRAADRFRRMCRAGIPKSDT